MRGFIVLALSLNVAACAVDASSNFSRDVSGQVIGAAQQRDVAAADSQIYLALAEFPVRSRRTRNLADRYDETVLFEGGAIRYERLTNLSGFSGSTTNVGAIQSEIDSDPFRRQNLSQPVSDLTRVVNRYGVAQFAIVQNRQWRCGVLSQYFWAGNGTNWATSPGNSELRGKLCYRTSDPRASRVESSITALLQHVQVGPDVNRGAAAEASATVAAVTAGPPPVPAASPVLTTSTFKVAPVGTRFVIGNGYLQIVRVDGYTVTTVNASNQTARWIGGLIAPRANSSIDPKPLDQLFPLAVGKETALEEVAGKDRWRYTIRVLRTEAVTLKNQTYSTFVIGVRDQSLTPDQGGFDRTRTYWYSPELGGIVRLRTTQAGGPSVRLLNWDVLDVVPPKAS